MKICMIGAGYVGLVSAACFSEFGWSVTCVENDSTKLQMLNSGGVPIYEPGLDDLLARNASAGRITFTGELAQAARDADLIFLAVGTPMRRGDGHADLSYIFAAVEELAPHLKGFTVITTKSTVPVGTSREIERRLRELRPDGDFAVCSNPEFLREGSAISDFTHPDRVLVGTDDPRAQEIMQRVYNPLALRKAPVIFTSRESAELAKYAANAFLATKISFINEIADLCEQVGASVQEVATAIGSDGRIGNKFLHPGPGYGGSCFPKDVSAIVRTGREAKMPLSLIEQVQRINEERKIAMAGRVVEAAGGNVRGMTIGVLGVTFKPNTDDMREAPSLVIIPTLLDKGATVKAHDPQGRANAEAMLEGVAWCENALDVAHDCDVLVILTEWNEYRALDLGAVSDAMRGRCLLDLRNVFNPADAANVGLLYRSIGRPTEDAAAAASVSAVRLVG
jgi:UDPglucose 6-dehydrogenase